MGDGPQRLARGQVPDDELAGLGIAVLGAGGNEASAVGGEAEAEDMPPVPAQDVAESAGGGVPQADLTPAARGGRRAVRRQGKGLDLLTVAEAGGAKAAQRPVG